MLDVLVNHECFFYGLPAKYALVDSLRYRLLMVAGDCYTLNFVKKLFESKKNLVVIELPENTIDNSVVLNWGIKKIVGRDLFPNKGELIITSWDKIIDPNTNKKELISYLGEEPVLCNDTTATEDDIVFGEQLLIGAEIALRSAQHPIVLSSQELDEIWQVFSISLDVESLVHNLVELGRRWYAQDNIHGSVVFNAVPEKYRYE